MKNYLTGLAALFTAINLSAQNGSLENPGFENWITTTLYETPQEWFSSNQFSPNVSVYRSSDARQGNYSAELRVNDEYEIVSAGLGEFAGEPGGGVPYTSPFNTVKFWYKSQFAAGDSIYVQVVRFSGAQATASYIRAAAYGTHSGWTEASFTIPAGTQQEVYIAFTTGSLNAGINNSENSWFRIDNVRLFDGSVQRPALPNFSLENWADVIIEDPQGWYTFNNAGVIDNIRTTVKTTDAHSGTYAAELRTMPAPSSWGSVHGILSLANTDLNSNDQSIPYVAMPTAFSGWYKFTPSAEGNDSPELTIQFYKDGEQLISFLYDFEPASEYTEFTVPITLYDQPDSVNVLIFSGIHDGATLRLDDVNFSGGSVGLGEFEKNSVSIYPNPATDKVMVKADGVYSFEMLTLSGSIVLSVPEVSGAQEADISNLNAGTYFVRIISSTSNEIYKLIVR